MRKKINQFDKVINSIIVKDQRKAISFSGKDKDYTMTSSILITERNNRGDLSSDYRKINPHEEKLKEAYQRINRLLGDN